MNTNKTKWMVVASWLTLIPSLAMGVYVFAITDPGDLRELQAVSVFCYLSVPSALVVLSQVMILMGEYRELSPFWKAAGALNPFVYVLIICLIGSCFEMK